MIDLIQGFGEFVIGILALIFAVAVVLAGLVEIFDRLTEKDETADSTKARLKSMQDDES